MLWALCTLQDFLFHHGCRKRTEQKGGKGTRKEVKGREIMVRRKRKMEREQKRRQQRRRKADPALGRGSALGLRSGSCLGFSRLQPTTEDNVRQVCLVMCFLLALFVCFPFFWQWTHLGWRRRRRSGAWPALTVVPGQALGW